MAATAILAGAGDLLPVIFVLIAIASGIINFVKERKNNEQGNMAGRGEPNADRKIQTEIDAFLQEVAPSDEGEAVPARQQQRRRRKAASEEEAERRRQVRARREHERRQQEEEQKRQSLRKRHLETSELGEVSDRHVESTVEDRHLEAQIDHLPTNELLTPDKVAEAPAVGFDASSVAALLRQPGGIRSALILSEIVGPPLATRPRRNRKAD